MDSNQESESSSPLLLLPAFWHPYHRSVHNHSVLMHAAAHLCTSVFPVFPSRRFRRTGFLPIRSDQTALLHNGSGNENQLPVLFHKKQYVFLLFLPFFPWDHIRSGAENPNTSIHFSKIPFVSSNRQI